MVATVIVLLGLSLLGEILFSYLRLCSAIATRPGRRAPLSRYPSVTVVRPVKGADVGCEANFEAALDTGYPGEVETLFVFDDAQDPSYPIAREVVRRHAALGRPGRAQVCVAGPPPPGMTGKLHAMRIGEALARGELIAFGDSDTRPDREVLRDTVEVLLGTPGAGSAFPPVVVGDPAIAAGDVGYAMLINAWYGPSVAMVSGPSRKLPFIMGQLMVFTRAALAAIGGVGCARGQLVDDIYIGKCVREAGFANVMTRHPLRIATGGMDFTSFVRLFRRWMLFSHGLPRTFTWPVWVRGCESWLALSSALWGLASGHPLAALVPLAALAAWTASTLSLHRRFGGAPIAPRHWLMPFSIPLIGPLVVLGSFFHREVEWRGRAYQVDAQARLA